MRLRHLALLLTTLVFLAPAQRLPAAPLTLTEDIGNIEGKWLFHTDPYEVGEKEGWQNPDLPDTHWLTLNVPGYWEPQGITDPRPGQPPKPKNGVQYTDYDGVAWYRLHFIVPPAWAGQDCELRLGSVDDQDRTFINDKLVGETGPGVDNPVSVQRIYKVPAALLKPGAENVLVVRVFDSGGPGGIPGPSLSLLPTKVFSAMSKLPQADRPFSERFSDPPAASRILKIIHSWPDAAPAQDALIQTLIGEGFGGVVCNVSFDQYLESEDHWKQLTRAIGEAKKAGMALWVYDERGYPSGAAGGLTLEGKLTPAWRTKGVPPPPALHPEWEARGLLIADAFSEGGEVALDIPPGKLVSVAAYPVANGKIALNRATDLSTQIHDGKLVWQAPVGSWHVMVITEDRLWDGTHSSVSFGDRLPYINMLMPEPTARFLELTHGRYAQHLGNDLGKTFISTFTDEPSLMSMFMRPMPYRVLPWAPNLPVEFAKRRGHALEPLVPALIADAGPAGQKARYDFWQTVGELVSENYFGQIQTWCHRHNFRSGGHFLAEESLLDHVALYGNFFHCARRMDAPSIDCLTSSPPEVPWFDARLLTSAGELEGKTVTMCETSDFSQVYRAEGDKRPVRNVTEEEIRGTCNRLMLNGINTITSYYTFGGLSGPQLRRTNNYVGRCCTALVGGDQVTDIALVYPIESIWPRFTPARQGPTDSASAADVEHTRRAAEDGLYGSCRDFTVVDSQALAAAKATGDALLYTKPGGAGKLSWRVVVLPCVDTLPSAAWENLARFWRQGGVVIAMGALPANSDTEFPSPKVQALAREMFGTPAGAGTPAEAGAATEAGIHVNAAGGAGVYLPTGAEGLLPMVLDSLLGRDVKIDAQGTPIRATHRHIDGHEVYFLINDSAAKWEGQVGFAATGAGELCDPTTGKITPLATPGNVPLSLEPYGGTLFQFAKAQPPKRLKSASGALPGLTLQALPEVTPGVGKGEFVVGDFARGAPVPDAEHSRPDAPAWRMAATLTKGNTDTFMFATFPYPNGIDLSGASCIAVESWVPEGQETPAELLVMLQEKNGAIYMTGTGRHLSNPGKHQAYVPISQFSLAGWSQDPNGKLDLHQIAAITVGWGGYFGKEGERVEFSLSVPKMGKIGE